VGFYPSLVAPQARLPRPEQPDRKSVTGEWLSRFSLRCCWSWPCRTLAEGVCGGESQACLPVCYHAPQSLLYEPYFYFTLSLRTRGSQLLADMIMITSCQRQVGGSKRSHDFSYNIALRTPQRVKLFVHSPGYQPPSIWLPLQRTGSRVFVRLLLSKSVSRCDSRRTVTSSTTAWVLIIGTV
jgi:hypothetical protein